MSWLANLRTLVFARRATVALESISESLKILARVAEDSWNAEHAPRKPTPTEIGSLDTTAAEVRWLVELGNRYGVDVTALNEAEIAALVDADKQRRGH